MLCLEIIPFFLLHQDHCLKAKQKQLDLFKETATRDGGDHGSEVVGWIAVGEGSSKSEEVTCVDHFVGSSEKESTRERERGERRSYCRLSANQRDDLKLRL